ncbi:MAG: Elongation factor P [Alphaproteobacteria bacterium MarineAlpha5_Bin9]|nr:MAG: Elongation factor P [Alphaproteobacteria bacterium MarineAlpha5_Bin9]|tara:strand:- start:9877 stop:10446 length:570 start_codon:yes stop_codon:yes gene_type:complete
MKIDGNQVKIGNILNIKSKLCKVTKTQHTQPGKGGAYIQVELKDIKDGTKFNERLRSSETVERIILDEKNCQFLYVDQDMFYFMDDQTYEQFTIGTDIITNNVKILLNESETYIIQFYESNPVGIILPDTISLNVIETEAVVKGQTAASSYKPAILENNIKTNVPPFIEIGNKVVINTVDFKYLEKSKN